MCACYVLAMCMSDDLLTAFAPERGSTFQYGFLGWPAELDIHLCPEILQCKKPQLFSLLPYHAQDLPGYEEVPHFFSVLSNCSNSSITLGICKFWVGTGWEQKLISVFWLGSVLYEQVNPLSTPKIWTVVWAYYLRPHLLGYDHTISSEET